MTLWNLTGLTSVGIEILQVYKQVKSVWLWSKQPTKKTTRATILVGILLAYGQILHDRIISLRAEFGSNKTCLDRHFLLKCLYNARKVCGRVYMCLVVTILTLPTIFLFHFGTIPTVWYFLFSILFVKIDVQNRHFHLFIRIWLVELLKLSLMVRRHAKDINIYIHWLFM